MEVRFYGMLLLSSNCPRPLGRWENAIWKTIWRTIQRDSITFGAAVEYHPSSPNDQARIHQFGKKLLPRILIGFELVAWENLERRYFDRRRGRFGKLDATDFYPRRINAEAHKKWWIRADGTATLLAGSCETKNPLWGGNRPWGQIQQMTLEPVPTSGRSKVTSTIVITVNFEFQLCVPKEETFLFLGVHWCYQFNTYWSGCLTRKDDWRLLECRFEQKFVRFLDRIFKVHSIERKKPSTRIHVVRKENDKNSHDDQTQIMVRKYRRELVTPLRIVKKQELAKERLELDNARKMKGFYFIDPDVRESSEIL